MYVHTRSQGPPPPPTKKTSRRTHAGKKKVGRPLKKKVGRPLKKIPLLFIPKVDPAPKAIKRSAELLYEVEAVLDARMGKYGPEYMVKWKGYAASKNQWIDELPSFFRRRCLLLLHKSAWGDSWATSSEEDDSDDPDSEDDSEDDSDDDSEDDSDSEDECTCSAGTRHKRCRKW
jgi:hypothetical protein